MPVVALAVSEGVSLFELAAACAVFGAPRPSSTDDWYQLQVCSPPQARVDQWFQARTPFTYHDLVAADLVIVPACHDGDLYPPTQLVTAVRSAYEAGARVMSICTGAFVLAEAGLLNGRRATTHWMATDELARRYPAVAVDAQVLYVDDGRILTSAGKAAGMDLCLHIVRHDYGAEVANDVARRLVAPPHRQGGQAQYITRELPGPPRNEFSPVIEWAMTHLAGLTVAQLAARANVSARTLHRRFKADTGAGPLEWLNQQRIRRAQELLERTDHTVEFIAHQCGFRSPDALRRHFRRSTGTTPVAYRQTFATRWVPD